MLVLSTALIRQGSAYGNTIQAGKHKNRTAFASVMTTFESDKLNDRLHVFDLYWNRSTLVMHKKVMFFNPDIA